MEELDKQIKQAKRTYVPRSNLGDSIMRSIKTKNQEITNESFFKRHTYISITVPVLAILVLAFVFVGYANRSTKSKTSNVASTNSPATNNTSTPQPVSNLPTQGSTKNGTDNASLSNSLSSINSSLNENQQSIQTASNDVSNQQLDNAPTN